MSRLCLRDLSRKGQVFLTRQGISLGPYSTMSLSGRHEHVVPACRHAVGTISSSDFSDVRRMVSEGSSSIAWPSLLITCTGRIVTMLKNHGTARYSQASQHIAGCSPHRHRCGGQRIYLRTVHHVATHLWAAGLDTRSACRHAGRTVSSP